MNAIRTWLAAAQARRGGGRSGQTLIFLLMILVILAFVVLWNFDLHKIITVKMKTQNAGDAAALAAARWQGISLNLIGQLNVLQAVAIQNDLARGEDDFDEAAAIADLEARLCFVGPMVAAVASQQAAKNNGLYANADFTETVLDHADDVQNYYAVSYPNAPYVNDPNPPTCWDDYAGMIRALGGQGVAVMPDNIQYYVDYSSSAHYLLNPAFYDAVSSRDWCWFYHNAMSLLSSYTGWLDWPPLPTLVHYEPMNSEYFSLRLSVAPQLDRLQMLDPGSGDVDDLVDRLEDLSGVSLTQGIESVSAQWYIYHPFGWRRWTELIPDGFPFEGNVKSKYDYIGADAAVRLETPSDRLTPGSGSDYITWSAAAKAFGEIEGLPPHQFSLVLPSFTDVRLVPVDTSTATSGGTQPGWADHMYHHLPAYAADGPAACVGSCWYCRQLITWEDPFFRRDGLEWIREYSGTCYVPPRGGGGGGGTGGTRRGH